MSTGGGGGQFLGGIYAELGLDDSQAQAKFAKIQETLERTKQKFNELFGQIAAGKFAPGPELDQATAKLQHYQDVMKGLQSAQDRLSSATTTVSTAMAGIQNGSSRAAQSLLAVGYAVDDLQYGFSAIQNNIPQLFVGMGPAAMGVAAIVATAAGLIVRHWSDIADAIGLVEKPLKTDAEMFDELAKATHRTADETERYIALRGKLKEEEEGTKAFAALPGRTPEEEARGKAFGEAVGKAGGREAVAGAIARAHPEVLEGLQSAEDRRTVERARAALEEARTPRFRGGGGAVGGAGVGEVRPEDPGTIKALEDALRGVELEANDRARKRLIDTVLGAAARGGEADIGRAIGLMPPALARGFAGVSAAATKKVGEEAARKSMAETDEEAKRLDELDAENLKKFTEARTKNRKTALERAQSLMKGEMGQQAIAGTLQERDVRDALERAGVAPDVAARRAGDVRDAMADIVRRQVRDRALGKGMTSDEAAVSLMEDEEKRRKREADAKFDKEKADALKAANEAIPDLAGQTERRLLHTPGAAQDVDLATQIRLQATLVGGGMGQDQAALAALLTVRDARKKLQDQAAKVKDDPFAMMELMGAGDEPKRKSQTMDALAYVRSIQAGVGGEDVGKKQLEKLDKQITTLNQIRLLLANQRRGVFLPAN